MPRVTLNELDTKIKDLTLWSPTQRSGMGGQKGLIFVLNNRGHAWNGAGVKTQWKNRAFVPVAWGGRDDARNPQEQQTREDGQGEFSAPPRGYAVYLPRD